MDFTTSTAPWFFVAGLAGGFTLLGTLLTLIGSRINEKAKETRAIKSRERDDLLSASIKLLSAAGAIREIALKRLSRNDLEYLTVYTKHMLPGLNSFKEAVETFRIEAPLKTVESRATKDLISITSQLMLPLFTNEEIKVLLGKSTIATDSFRNQVRKDRGSKPLKKSADAELIDGNFEKSVGQVMRLIGDAVERPEVDSTIRASMNELKERLRALQTETSAEDKSTPDEGAPSSEPVKS
ncbi:hypothetical protein [Rathayibacter sp. Leaf248]|uniref:hypothetical protein n=1 Tax=Rathayibacter sp. Leaf248 TaxID=2876555 RepID=UPI001E3888A4|nr:hypothetical protein [Rathayibacter sp. Leaf248]